MNNNHLYLFLKTISSNSSVKRLTREGISFKTIAEYTNLAIRDSLIINKENRIVLTEIGESRLSQLEPFYKKTNKEDWILPDTKNKIRQIDKNNIFLPWQDELDF